MRRRRTVRLALFLVALVGLLLSPWPAAAQEGMVVEGRIVNGTAGGQVPPGLPVTLEVVRRRSLVALYTATAGDDGSFRFAGVPAGPDLSYVVSTSYQGVVYTATARGEEAWRQPLTLSIYEKEAGVRALRLPSFTLVVTGVAPRRRLLEFLGAVQVENPTDRTAVADMALVPGGLLRFPIPLRAQDLDVASTLPPGGQVVQGEREFALTTPVPPGRHEVLFTYRVVYHGEALDVSLPMPLGVDVFHLMFPEEVGAVEGASLTPQEPVTIGGRVYRLVGARGVRAGEEVGFRLVGLPQPPWPIRVAEALGRPPWMVVLPSSLLGVTLLGLLVWALRRPSLREGG
jgi:hypothetical protein